jgi:ketosteroid isomerase-like protein
MSENLDLVRSIYARWKRGDFGFAEWADPQIVFAIADGPQPGTWRGLAGMTEGWRGHASAWEGYRIQADEYRELDHERVLVRVHRGGRGKASGLELGEVPTGGAHVFAIRDGKVISLTAYADHERALADLGLGPEGPGGPG